MTLVTVQVFLGLLHHLRGDILPATYFHTYLKVTWPRDALLREGVPSYCRDSIPRCASCGCPTAALAALIPKNLADADTATALITRKSHQEL